MHPQTRRYIECVVLLTLTGTFARMEGAKAGDARQVKAPWSTGYRSYIGSQSMQVGATVRAFAPGHADFRRTNALAPGRYTDIFAETLGPDSKPVFASTGARVEAAWRDASGRDISRPRSYIRGSNGDTAGRVTSGAGDAVQSAQTVSQWFRDTPGVNTSSRTGVTLRHDGSNYVFDGSLDTLAGGSRDYTAELEYNFVYEPGRDWYIAAGTNAEVWVYIDDKLVIDGGGLGGVTFRIENGAVITTAPAEAEITVVGAAIQSGSTPCPVTVRATAGGTAYEPFGSFASPTAGNVNTPTGNPRRATLARAIAK